MEPNARSVVKDSHRAMSSSSIIRRNIKELCLAGMNAGGFFRYPSLRLMGTAALTGAISWLLEFVCAL